MTARPVLALTLALAVLPSFDAGPASRTAGLPRLVLWAWERPVDLRALPPGIGVAFLAQTITASAGASVVAPRRQPLLVAPAAPLIAVTRIETPTGESAPGPVNDIAHAIGATAALPRVVAIQIDFDAVASQRPMYRQLLHAVRRALPPAMPLTITALASWCMQDTWLDDLPIDEAALAHAVEGTRWGCTDGQSSAASRAAFQTLHRVFPKSEWALKTRYWY